MPKAKRERRERPDNYHLIQQWCWTSEHQQRLAAVRLFFDFLIEEGKRTDHPVGRGRYTPGKSFELIVNGRWSPFPDIALDSSEEQWRAFLAVVKQAPLRTPHLQPSGKRDTG